MGNAKAGCKVCNHSELVTIEKLKFVDEMTVREIEAYITEHFPNEKVSYATVSRHFQHVSKKREIQIKYMFAKKKELEMLEKEAMISDVDLQINELQKLDNSIDESLFLVKAASKELRKQLTVRVPKYVTQYDKHGNKMKSKFVYEKADISHAVVQLFKSSSEELRQAVKIKSEILGTDAKSENTDKVSNLVDVLLGIDND